MPVTSNEPKRLSDLVKKEFWIPQGWCRKEVTVNQAAQTTYVLGTTMGKITASGKYIVAKETAVDGSKVIDAIFIGKDGATVGEDLVIAAATDTKVLVMIRGPLIVGDDVLLFDATYDNATKLGVAYDNLEAKDISIETQI